MDLRAVRSIVAVCVCLLVLAGAACQSGPDDAAITTAVKAKMAADTTVSATSINVDTKEGVVTLTGSVESAAAKSQAETIAKATEGVKSVTNNLTVKPATATMPSTPAADATNDTAIENAIAANLAKAGITGVEVEVEDGVATLKGTVAKGQMMKAMQAANEANPKAQQIKNQLAEK